MTRISLRGHFILVCIHLIVAKERVRVEHVLWIRLIFQVLFEIRRHGSEAELTLHVLDAQGRVLFLVLLALLLEQLLRSH